MFVINGFRHFVFSTLLLFPFGHIRDSDTERLSNIITDSVSDEVGLSSTLTPGFKPFFSTLCTFISFTILHFVIFINYWHLHPNPLICKYFVFLTPHTDVPITTFIQSQLNAQRLPNKNGQNTINLLTVNLQPPEQYFLVFCEKVAQYPLTYLHFNTHPQIASPTG